MTYALIAALILESVGFIILVDRLVSRGDRQVADLCQRIQAPDTAVAQHVVDTQAFEPSHLPFDDDGAWMDYVGKQIGTDDLG